MPTKFKYSGPLAILINEGSGSASELFSGVMQKRGIAALMGENSAGQVLLKSMFDLEDGSMMLLVTGRGHHPDGSVFSFRGLSPNRYFGAEEDRNIIDYATMYLIYKNKMKEKDIK
ncbi:MAG: S41 family peptidase [Candidatus Zapsychrus exili]|nr:S41 family peptidase [Candidatus Zapsychrus exili]